MPPIKPAPDPNPHRPIADRILAAALRRLDHVINEKITHSHSSRSVAAQCGDAPALRRDRDRADEQTGELLALTLRSDLKPTRSLLDRLELDEPPLEDEDTEEFIPETEDASDQD